MKRVMVMLTLLLFVMPMTVVTAESVVIDIGMAETSQQAGLDYMEKVLIPKFESENPDIGVEMSVVRWSYDTYVTRYAANVPPDAFQLGGDRIGTYVPMIEPLDNYASGWRDIADFPEVLIEGCHVNGKLYGIPWSMPSRSLFYRVDHFEEAGLDANKPPETWDDLITYGKRLSRIDNTGQMTQQGLSMDGHWFDFAVWLFQAGGDFMDSTFSKFTFADSYGMEAAGFMRATVQEHKISDPARKLGDIRSGDTAMEYRQGTILSQPEYRDIVQVAYPTKLRKQLQVSYGNSWAITNISKHKDAAWKWISFVTRIDNMVAYANAALIVPPRKSVLKYEPWSRDPRFVTFFGAAAMGKGLPFNVAQIDQVRKDYIQPTLNRIIYENAPFSDLTEAERLATAYLHAN